MSSLPSHVSRSSFDFTLQDPHRKHQEARTSVQGDIEATTQSKYDAFKKGATLMARASQMDWDFSLGCQHQGKHDALNRENGT